MIGREAPANGGGAVIAAPVGKRSLTPHCVRGLKAVALTKK